MQNKEEKMEQALRYMEKFLNDEKIREQYDMAYGE